MKAGSARTASVHDASLLEQPVERLVEAVSAAGQTCEELPLAAPRVLLDEVDHKSGEEPAGPEPLEVRCTGVIAPNSPYIEGAVAIPASTVADVWHAR